LPCLWLYVQPRSELSCARLARCSKKTGDKTEFDSPFLFNTTLH
jgi:hypothetical protein